MTYQETLDFVFTVVPRDHLQPQSSVIRTLLNIAVAQMPGIDVTWANDYELTSNRIRIPSTLRDVKEVRYNGEKLTMSNRSALSVWNDEWETTSGVPELYVIDKGSIVLDRVPENKSAGVLEIDGEGPIPPFSTNPADPNPFDYIPDSAHMLPAYYLIAHAPVRTSEYAQVAAQYMSMWREGLSDMYQRWYTRRGRPFTY